MPEVNASLQFTIDRSKLQDTLNGVNSLKAALTTVGGETAKDTEAVKALSTQAAALARTDAINQITLQFTQLARETANADDAIEQMTKALQEVGASSAEIDKATNSLKEMALAGEGASGSVKDVSGGLSPEKLRRFGGVLSSVGLGGVGGVVSQVGDIAVITKDLQLLGQSLGIVDASATAASSGGIMALITSLGPLIAIAAPVIAALGGLKLILDALQASAQKSADATHLMLIEQQKEIDQKEKNRQLIATAAPGAVDDKIAQDKQAIVDIQTAIAQNRLAKQQSDQLYGAITGNAPSDILARTNLKASGDQLDTDFGTLTTQLSAAFDDMDNLAKNVKPATDLKEAAQQATALAKTIHDDQIAYFDQLAKDHADQVAQEQAFRDKQTTTAVAAITKYNDAVAKANTEGDQALLDIQKKYLENVATLTQNELDQVQSNLQKLTQARADAFTQANRDGQALDRKYAQADLETQIKEQQTYRDDLVAHLQKVRDIQHSFDAQFRDAELNRNFLQLFQLQEQKKTQVTAEGQAYQDKQTAEAQKNADDAARTERQRVFEGNERAIAFKAKLADLQLQYVRENQAAADNLAKQLDIAQKTRDGEITAAEQKRDTLIKLAIQTRDTQISLANQTAQQIAAAYTNLLNQAHAAGFTGGGQVTPNYSQTNPQTTQSGGVTIRRFASGGSFGAGQPFLFDEAGSSGREKVSIGGQSFGATGAAFVYPLQGGSVSPGGAGGGTYHIYQNNTFTSADPKQIMPMITRQTVTVLKQVMGRGGAN